MDASSWVGLAAVVVPTVAAAVWRTAARIERLHQANEKGHTEAAAGRRAMEDRLHGRINGVKDEVAKVKTEVAVVATKVEALTRINDGRAAPPPSVSGADK